MGAYQYLDWISFGVFCRIHQMPKKENLQVWVKVGFWLFDDDLTKRIIIATSKGTQCRSRKYDVVIAQAV